MIETLWFCLVAIMIAGYVVLDGFDLGAGIVHLFVARDEGERSRILSSIGPVWDGNEVWLLAGGGTLYFAFPALYASSFSGFYLALMIVLWLLILRGISIEIRNHIDSRLWKPFWDIVFGAASAILALVFGVALGNVVRGVPIDSSGYFFIPLWTNFLPGNDVGIVDTYTLLVGLTAFTTLAVHGSTWVILRSEGELRRRTIAFASRAWWILLGLALLTTFFSFRIQPNLAIQFAQYPAGLVFPILAVAGLIGIRLWMGIQNALAAFLASGVFIVGMLTSAAFGVFPYVLPSNTRPDFSLTVHNAAAPAYGLQVGLWWWIPGMALAILYSVFVYSRLASRREYL